MNQDAFFAAMDQHAEAVPINVLVELMKKLDITRADVEDTVAFGDEHYKRNVLRVGSGYAALVLCWRPGQASPIHDHRGSACGVRVLAGTLTETKYTRGADGMVQPGAVGTMSHGQVCGSYDADIHVIGNEQPAGDDLITLHVYTPPLQNYHIYHVDSTEVEVRSDEETLRAQQELAAQR